MLQSKSIAFFVEGRAISLGRARFLKAGGTYLPKSSREYRKRVQRAAKAQCNGELFTGDIGIDILETRAIPKSWPKRRQEEALYDEIRPTGRPDLDNIVKAILDACNGVVWVDDAQVTTIQATKRYGKRQGVEVHVREWNMEDAK